MSVSRRRLAYPLFAILILSMVGAGTLMLMAQKSLVQGVVPISRFQVTSNAPVGSASSLIRVTKSLEQLKEQVPITSDHVLFFNHVPKAGGEMLVLLLQWLQGINGFRHIRLGGGDFRQLNRMEQEELVDEVTKRIRDEAVPVSFDRHVYFLNFSQYDRQSPMYINLVRDPAEKAASRFYYTHATPNPKNPDMKQAPKRKYPKTEKSFDRCIQKMNQECSFMSGVPYDLSIPYFCGHEHWCMMLNNMQALETAKANVERYFPVVGVLEELNATLAVLEKQVPYFFKGVQDLYFRELLEPHHNKNQKRPKISKESREYLEKALLLEYEFYYWLRARLLNQYYKRTGTVPTLSRKYPSI